MAIDRRRRQWVPLHVNVAHGRTGTRLKEEFGRDGLLVWMLYLAACKANPIQGEFSYTSEADGWTKLGIYDDEDHPDFTLDAFFTATGRMKKTSRRRVGRIVNVVCTPWADWSDTLRRDADASKKARKRAQNTGDIQTTLDRLSVDDWGDRERPRHESENDQQQQTLEEDLVVDDARAPKSRETGEPAAAEPLDQPPSDLQVEQAVRSLPGHDPGSLQQVLPLTTDLPASLFHDTLNRTRDRIAGGQVRNAVGLFVDLLRSANTEHRQRTADAAKAAIEAWTPEHDVEEQARSYARGRHPWPVAEELLTHRIRRLAADDPDALLEHARAAYHDQLNDEPALAGSTTTDDGSTIPD